MSVNTRLRVALLACAMLAAASAWALKSDQRQPINIQADHGDFQGDSTTSNGTGVYTGHVLITQGSIRITADTATLHMVNGQIQTADMRGGPATFQQQPDSGPLAHGTANEITYDAGKNRIDLLGDARLQQGERLLAADVIHYDTDSEHVIASGGKTSGGRVHITIPPRQQPDKSTPP
ncbi:MAG: lipopolysaccharide transport periplasmic protein LptA [Gammaproteobacteria bacterium]|nr:lipopolysaccharide transport periplasmic protein LptA [Gammaproteobacteria bacterium]